MGKCESHKMLDLCHVVERHCDSICVTTLAIDTANVSWQRPKSADKEPRRSSEEDKYSRLQPGWPPYLQWSNAKLFS